MNYPDISYFWPEWKITGYLGRSAYCFHYLAESELDGEPVYSSIKVIKMPQNEEYIPEIYKNGVSPEKLSAYFAQFKDKLNWELRLFRSVTSPHVMHIDDMHIVTNTEKPGWTAFIRGGLFTPLSEYVSQIDFDAGEVLRLGRELCKALMICSRSGMLHGHVNPENIYVMDNGQFVLCDFGLRRCLGAAGNLLFTKPDDSFDAPEVKENKEFREESDLYSLAKIMQLLLRTAELRKLGGEETDLSGLTETIEMALCEKPEERFQNAATMLANLNSLDIPARAFARRTAAVALAKEIAKRYEEQMTAEEETKEETREEYRSSSEILLEKIEQAEQEKAEKAALEAVPEEPQEEPKKGFFAKLRAKFKK